MKVTYSAPAKVILSGEHSVVYTKPAFVTAVDFHLTATIEDGSLAKPSDTVQKAVVYIDTIIRKHLNKEHIKAEIRPFSYAISSTIPEGRGMGSSAAFCVAVAASLCHFYTGHEGDKQLISSLAYKCEKYFHGMPSGVDVSASCYGGLIYYRKEFEFLKTISSLNFKIPKNFEERMILIDTGKPVESTKEMVAHVGKRYNQDAKHMEQTFSAIEKVTKRMVVSIVKEDLSMFKESIEANQSLLEELGIVSDATKEFIKSISVFGTGKVTGAGGYTNGSGLILFLVDDEEIYTLLKKRNIQWLPFKQDLKGVIFVESA